MKRCPSCNHETEDDAVFCPQCGCEFKKEKKKFAFVERREAREREKNEIMAKSYITKEQVAAAEPWDDQNLVLTKQKKIQGSIISAYIRLFIAIIIFVLGVVWIEFSARGSLNPNIKLLIIAVVFFACAASVVVFINDIFYIKTLYKMKKSKVAIKKIKYGQPPVVYHEGYIYSLEVKGNCLACNSQTHIEEVDGEFVVVCNQNRMHIYKIDTKNLLNNKLFSEKESKNVV